MSQSIRYKGTAEEKTQRAKKISADDVLLMNARQLTKLVDEHPEQVDSLPPILKFLVAQWNAQRNR